MGKCCTIIGCRSGYKSNPERVSVFSPPRDLELLKEWSNAISRPNYIVNDKSYVCEKHFAPEQIIAFYIYDRKSSLLPKVPNRILLRLKKNAVPSIFTEPASQYVKIRKPPTKQKNVILKSHEVERIDYNSVMNTNLYNLIKCSASEGNLKHYYSCYWTDITGQKMGSTDSNYSFVSFCHRGLFPVIEKAVSVSTNGDITFGILGNEIEAKELDIIPAKNLEDFANNLRIFENIYVCHRDHQ